MTDKPEHPAHGETRRQFLKRSAAAAVAAGGSLFNPAVFGQQRLLLPTRIAVVPDSADDLLKQPPVRWALGELQRSLDARGPRVRFSSPKDPDIPLPILVAGRTSPPVRRILKDVEASIPDAPEAMGLVRGQLDGRPIWLASGSDVRGVVYALLELADRVEYAEDPLAELQKPARLLVGGEAEVKGKLPEQLQAARGIEQPANPIRSVARLFASEVEDKSWFYDKAFWQRYLTMLISQRFNRFSLTLGLGYDAPRQIADSYFYFAYPFLVSVPGYKVEAVGLPKEERERNLEMLHWISDQAVLRGLHFQLGLWNHAYKFADSPKVNYAIAGLTPENHAAYCRDALGEVLKACPAIGGITFRAHSESGIPEGSYDFWQTLFDGIAHCGRRIEIDLHSKGIDHKLIGIALKTEMPVNVSPKYWAEHMGLPYHQAAIRGLEFDRPAPGSKAKLEQQRKFTRYGYADYLREDRQYGVLFRIWPGTQRLLLWGDPAWAAAYGRHAHFCGSLGLELCEPLSFKGRKGSGLPGGRDAYADASLRPAGGDWEKYLYSYRLWGRLLYNPDADPDSWQRFLRQQYGPAASDCEAALAHASRVLPLVTTAHLPSASNNAYWPEIYTNMPIVDAKRPHPYGDTPSPKRFGSVSPLDPAMFSSTEEFADELLSGRPAGKYSPLDVAAWLDRFALDAAKNVAAARSQALPSNTLSFRRLAIDVSVQAGIGRFFAEKFRAGVAYAIYEKTGERAVLEEAIRRYSTARDAWAKLAAGAKAAYLDDVTFGAARHLRGHWTDRLTAIEEDLADMEKKRQENSSAASPSQSTEGSRAWAAAQAAADPLATRPRCRHVPPKSFRRDKAITIEIAAEEGIKLAAVRLHYRHVNQADEYQVVEMPRQDGRFQAVIPAEYTDSPYPLMYYFELHGPGGGAWLYPGFTEDLSNQPYFVIRRG